MSVERPSLECNANGFAAHDESSSVAMANSFSSRLRTDRLGESWRGVTARIGRESSNRWPRNNMKSSLSRSVLSAYPESEITTGDSEMTLNDQISQVLDVPQRPSSCSLF